jgi:endo-1,4-beta-mannosidase
MADVNKRRASGKLTTSASLMVPAIEKLEDFQNSEAYKEAPNQSDLLKTWLEGQMKRSRQQVRDLLFKISQATFSVVVGQIWFKEFGSLDENSLTIDVDNAKLVCKVEMKELKVEV